MRLMKYERVVVSWNSNREIYFHEMERDKRQEVQHLNWSLTATSECITLHYIPTYHDFTRHFALCQAC